MGRKDKSGANEPPKSGGWFRESVIVLGTAALLMFIVQGYGFKPYKIPTGSMENTLRCQDRVIANRLSYRFGDPKRGDIVVFHPPRAEGAPAPVVRGTDVPTPPWSHGSGVSATASSTTYIKRLVGLPGDKLEVRDRHVYINGKKQTEPFVHPDPGTDKYNVANRFKPSIAAARKGVYEYGPITVPAGTYFMMGDNRTESQDGRWFGPIPRGFMIGPAIVRYWPLESIGKISSSNAGTPKSARDDPKCPDDGA